MVLIVDADQGRRLLLRALLKEEGYEAEAFEDPLSAEACLRRWVSLVTGIVYVSPSAMPGAESLEILARLAERAFLVIISSAWQREAWEGMGWPRLTVLPRPMSIGQVVEAVKASIGGTGGGKCMSRGSETEK